MREKVQEEEKRQMHEENEKISTYVISVGFLIAHSSTLCSD